jgi:hypothetical protein
MNEIILKWNQILKKGIALSTTTKINTLSLTADQVITDDSEGNLQMGVFTLQT